MLENELKMENQTLYSVNYLTVEISSKMFGLAFCLFIKMEIINFLIKYIILLLFTLTLLVVLNVPSVWLRDNCLLTQCSFWCSVIEDFFLLFFLNLHTSTLCFADLRASVPACSDWRLCSIPFSDMNYRQRACSFQPSLRLRLNRNSVHWIYFGNMP